MSAFLIGTLAAPSAFTRGADCWHDVTAEPDQEFASSMLPPPQINLAIELPNVEGCRPIVRAGKRKVMRRSLDLHGSNFASRNKHRATRHRALRQAT